MGNAQAIDDFEERKDSILDAAIRLISRDGAPALTLRGLAEEAGCNRQTPYRYFRSREAILAEAYLHCHKIFTDYGEKAIEGVSEPREVLVKIRDAYLKFAEDEPKAYEVVFTMKRPVYDERVVEQLQYASGRLRTMFVEVHAAGLIEDDPIHMSYMYWSLLHAAVRLQNSKSDLRGLNVDRL